MSKKKLKSPTKDSSISSKDESNTEKRKRQIGYAFLAIFGLGLSQFVLVIYTWLVPSYVKLSVDNPVKLKEVFFSGQPYLVLCNDGVEAVHSTFEQVAKSVAYSREFKTATLDCNAKLPSGKTTLERFKIKPLPKKSKKHLALVFYNGNKKPKQVPFGYLSDTSVKESLLTWTKELVQLRYGRVTNDKTFEYCTKRKNGNVLLIVNGTLSDTNKRNLAHLMSEHRLLRFCTLNNERYQLIGNKMEGKSGDTEDKKKKKMKRLIKTPKELKKGEALIVGLKFISMDDSENDEGVKAHTKKSKVQKNRQLAIKSLSMLGEPPSPSYFLEQLRETKNSEEIVDTLKMKFVEGRPIIRTRKSYRKKQNTKYKRKRKKGSTARSDNSKNENETPKERRARLKREHMAKQTRKHDKTRKQGSPVKNNKDIDGYDLSVEERQRLQRERELERRRAMDAEAKQHFAQGVDEEDEEDYYDEQQEDNDDEDQEIDLDEDDIDLDEEDDTIDLDEMED
jgi:hypothetical protein